MELIPMIISLIILIYSAILHEVAHGFVADRLGDPTARLLGRLTLNPKNHIDPFMSIAIPLLLLISGSPVIIGAAKPVPVDPFNLKEGRKDIALVSLAGPLTNILIAIFAALILRTLSLVFTEELFFLVLNYLLTIIIQLNLLLAIFNLIPIPPLDGSKVFALILPEKDARIYLSFGSIGFFVIFFLLMFPIGGLSLSSLIFNLLSFAMTLLGA